MGARLPDSVSDAQPNSVQHLNYRARMADDLKKVVAGNVRALLGLQPGEKGIARLIALGFSNGNAQRVLGGETSIGLDVLGELAKALNVQPWQLCTPNLEPDRLPELHPQTFRWPFRQIDPEVITGLVGTPASNVENGLLIVLASAGISPRKRTGTHG